MDFWKQLIGLWIFRYKLSHHKIFKSKKIHILNGVSLFKIILNCNFVVFLDEYVFKNRNYTAIFVVKFIHRVRFHIRTGKYIFNFDFALKIIA